MAAQIAKQPPTFWDHVTTWAHEHPLTAKALMVTGIVFTILGTLGMIATAPIMGIPLAVVLILTAINFGMIVGQTWSICNFDTMFPPDRIIKQLS